ncbi:zinc-ribbon domain-containing protein [Methanococcoides sp. FTZ1]|uniref:zinc ribbon domain-containing protein n=1 Tax=Methanococcoides sp. FTZ1 TaxID=3439061 RepID=UPI003F835985
MFCSNCGNEIGDNDKFCSVCGQQIDKTADSTVSYDNISPNIPIKEKKESNIWSSIIIISLVGLALIYGSAFMGGFMEGMSSEASPIGNSDNYYNIVVESQISYEYSTSSNQNIIVNCYFDTTNIGTAGGDNVQVDYSLLFDDRVLESSTIFLGSVSAGSDTHREKGHSVTLTNSEWRELKNDITEITIEVDEIRAE